MARCIRLATSFNHSFMSKSFQCSNALSSFCGFHKIKPGLRSSFTSTAISRCKDDAAEHNPFKYNWIDGAEAIERYKPGGYHPVMIGDVLHNRYQIVDKLGFGGYSTVWLAQDKHREEYVAVKVGIANSLSQEIKCLRALSASSAQPDQISSPLDEFEVHGPNGTHPCYTMVPARCNLREASSNCLFPLDVARALVGGLTMAIAHMHSCGYIHGDIHLRNILVNLPSSFNHLTIKQFYEEYGEPETASITLRDGSMLPPNPNIPPKAVIPLYLGKEANEFKLQDAHALLSDFGESYHVSEVRRGEDCHTPLAMRPPEARFEPRSPLSYSADIWSLAIAIWEILGMKALFSNEYITEDEMVSEHIDVLGPMPRSWLERWEKRGEFFDDENGRRPKEGREVWPELEDAFQQGVQSYRQKFAIGVFGEEETRAILNLIRQMLAFQPEKRPTIEDVLGSEWMVKWVLPDLERCDRVRSENSN